MEAARKAVQKKEIYGYLSIPPKFGQDAISGKNATLSSYYYHYALLSVGGELMAAFENVAGSCVALSHCDASCRSRVEQDKITSHSCCPYKPAITLYTIQVWIIPVLSEPTVFFVLFQVLILLITVYAVRN